MPIINPDSPLLTRPQIAQMLSVSREYLDHKARRGDGPPFIKIGRLVRYHRETVSAWLADQTTAA